jgi:hypothetical protein
MSMMGPMMGPMMSPMMGMGNPMGMMGSMPGSMPMGNPAMAMDPAQWMSMFHMGSPQTQENFMQEWTKSMQNMMPKPAEDQAPKK